MKYRYILPFLAFLMLIPGSCKEDKPRQFFVFLNTNPDREVLPEEKVAALQEKHLANIQRLANEGDLVAAGPFEGGGGIFILIAGSEEKARELLATDPAISANRFRIEVLPLEFIKGGICPYHEPMDMGTYAFYRFREGPKQSKQLLKAHYQQLASLGDEPEVLVIARFDDSGDGFLMLESSLTDDWTRKIIDNQAVREGALEVDAKNLWTARGTFCD